MSLLKHCTLDVKPFTVSHTDQELSDLHTLLKLSPLAPATYESTQPQFGVTSAWMKEAKEYWLDETRFNWRDVEKKLNQYPQFTTPIAHKGDTHTIHFVGLFSSNPDATPLLLLHGWPGSFLEYYPLLSELKKSDKYHVIVPSLPGYCYSSKPPVDKPCGLETVVALMNNLMVGLGFGKDTGGYLAQGGDIGSILSRMLTHYEDCRGCLLNMWIPLESDDKSGPVSDLEQAGIDALSHWELKGRGYWMMHATRPSTIGHVLSSSPLALLAWVGEKLVEWCDPTSAPDMQHVLEIVALWWLTQTFATSIYPYRQLHANDRERLIKLRDGKPYGFSWFPKEIMVSPRSWIERAGNCVFFERHTSGGHFAAMEKPKELAGDIDGFVEAMKVWEVKLERLAV